MLKFQFYFILLLQLLNIDVHGEIKHTNVVLILADDLGYECLSTYGAAEYKTPNLDKLAEDGIKFNHCYAQPVCTPTRVKLMTGLYNKRNYERFGYLPAASITFANSLKNNGYTTCVVGKWQLLGGLEGPNKFGFDEYCLWQLTRKRTKEKGQFDTRYENPQLDVNGKTMDYNNGEFGPDIINKYACDFIKKNKDKPFLLYYPMLLNHCPFVPTPDTTDWNPKSPGSKSYKGDPKYFSAMVNYLDKMVGNVIKTLDDNGLTENTLVMFLGDNGTDFPIVTKMKDGSSVKGMKGTTLDGGTHVPFIAKWPAVIKGNRINNDMVDLTDFYPTICEVTKSKPPEKLDGISLTDVFKGEKHLRQWSYCWYKLSSEKNISEFVRNQHWKLYSDNKFYDMKNNPEENKPLNIDKLNGEALEAYTLLKKVMDEHANIRPQELLNLQSEKSNKEQ